jgi:hypothetical protein
MTLAIPIVLIGLLALALWLLRDTPIRTRLGVVAIGAAAAAIVGLVAAELARIDSMYQEPSTLRSLVRVTASALDAGECERARAAFVAAEDAIARGDGGLIKTAQGLVRELDSGTATESEPAADGGTLDADKPSQSTNG